MMMNILYDIWHINGTFDGDKYEWSTSQPKPYYDCAKHDEGDDDIDNDSQ